MASRILRTRRSSTTTPDLLRSLVGSARYHARRAEGVIAPKTAREIEREVAAIALREALLL